ncbi:HutD family protein [uncultured Nocardioides sp.]|uniref:HutD/Ves family protein n=1 Tax=uncultured Nocardioides sp. TaxID=198441 RepID=UPI00260F72ED|nr:HutD family protein [uncultured Nocardioides sp.]
MTGARTVRAADVRPRPWANGGGTTRELAVADDGAWRISLADVDRDGPFSTFAGRQRLLTVVEGPVLDLQVDGDAQVVEPQRPFAFSGDASTVASVPEGPVRVLNVVVDPARVRPHVTVLELGRSSTLPVAADQAAYVVSGARDGLETGSLVLGPGEVAGRCTVAVVTLDRVS